MMDITAAKWPAFVIALATVLVSAKSSAADKDSVKPAEQAVVVDALEHRLGSIIGLNGPLATILIEIGGSVVSLNVAPNQLLGTSGPLYFITKDCTGTPYVPALPPALVASSTLAGPGNSLYVGKPNAIPQLITALSTLPPAPPGVPPICLSTTPPPPPPPAPPPPGPPQVFAVPALRLVDLNGIFMAPFRIRTSD